MDYFGRFMCVIRVFRVIAKVGDKRGACHPVASRVISGPLGDAYLA